MGGFHVSLPGGGGRGDEGSWASRAMEGDGRGQQTRITKEVGLRLRRTSLEAWHALIAIRSRPWSGGVRVPG